MRRKFWFTIAGLATSRRTRVLRALFPFGLALTALALSATHVSTAYAGGPQPDPPGRARQSMQTARIMPHDLARVRRTKAATKATALRGR